MSSDVEPDVLAAARAGDAGALNLVLMAHQDAIHGFASAMCRQDQDAEGVLQDTMLAMARSITDFRGDASTRTWALTIARNACLRRRRKGKFAPDRVDSLDLLPGVADEDDSPEDLAAASELLAATHSAVLALEPMYREVLLLRDVEQLTAPEVAERLDLSIAAVKSRLHRARMQVREALGGDSEG